MFCINLTDRRIAPLFELCRARDDLNLRNSADLRFEMETSIAPFSLPMSQTETPVRWSPVNRSKFIKAVLHKQKLLERNLNREGAS